MEFHHQAAFPGVWQMRGVVPADFMFSQLQGFSIGQRPGRSVGNIIYGDHSGNSAAHRFRFRRGRKDVIERAAFIRLEV